VPRGQHCLPRRLRRADWCAAALVACPGPRPPTPLQPAALRRRSSPPSPARLGPSPFRAQPRSLQGHCSAPRVCGAESWGAARVSVNASSPHAVTPHAPMRERAKSGSFVQSQSLKGCQVTDGVWVARAGPDPWGHRQGQSAAAATRPGEGKPSGPRARTGPQRTRGAEPHATPRPPSALPATQHRDPGTPKPCATRPHEPT
jgi:hypothetical protein